MASGRRGYVWVLKKSGVFRDSAQNILQRSAELHTSKTTHIPFFRQIHTYELPKIHDIFANKECMTMFATYKSTFSKL
jgi:hypothetical protein